MSEWPSIHERDEPQSWLLPIPVVCVWKHDPAGSYYVILWRHKPPDSRACTLTIVKRVALSATIQCQRIKPAVLRHDLTSWKCLQVPGICIARVEIHVNRPRKEFKHN